MLNTCSTGKRNRQRSRIGLLCLGLAVLVLGGCASPGDTPGAAPVTVAARDDAYAIVRLQPGQSLESVAAELLGDAGAAWQLRESNPGHPQTAGSLLAVPLAPTRRSSVYTTGYRVLPVLCYHQFTNAEQPAHRLEITATAFAAQLRFLRDQGYRTLSLDDVEQILAAGGPIPPRAVVLTIDDGFRSTYDIAWPLLQQYQARATLFVYTGFIGGGDALSWDQVRELHRSPLIDIASHGHSHASLAPLPDDRSPDAHRARVMAELERSQDLFARQLGEAPRFLSYPYGNISPAAFPWVEAAGISLAATVTRGDNPSFAHPLLLHRTMVYSDHDLEDFAAFVDSFRELAVP